MSLVGNLEDLSLGDILQIISLSQKSGVLALDSDQGSGRIVFRSGLVQAACIKGGPNDLRALLVGGRFIDPTGFDASMARAEHLGTSIEELLARDAELPPERLQALIREAAEAAILEMFSWLAGDFSFDVRAELEADDPQLILETGINAQYLAMEGMRIRDEALRGGVESIDLDLEPEDATDAVDLDVLSTSLFGDEPLETALVEADVLSPDPFLDTLELEPERPQGQTDSGAQEAGPSAADVLVASVLESEGEEEADSADEAIAAVVPELTTGPRELEAEVEHAAASTVPSLPRVSRDTPVVLIDPDVSGLEWVKTAIAPDFVRVHVFQQAEQGLARIRQYLIRGELPLVLISPEAQIDPLSGIHGLGDFVKRLKTQASRIVILGLREDDEESPAAMPATLDGVLTRPARAQLRERGGEVEVSARARLARSLQEILCSPDPAAARQPEPEPEPEALREDVSARLREATSRGEILPVVLDFTAELFARAAILIVRGEEVFAIAGRGIASLEVDPLDTPGPVSLPILASGWIRTVLDRREPLIAPPTTDADRTLLERFGGIEPASAYLGPIESGGVVVALVYGDQAGGTAEMPDTQGLALLLRHAGLALDRAARERAVWEADAGRKPFREPKIGI